jgi:hypothetical protein
MKEDTCTRQVRHRVHLLISHNSTKGDEAYKTWHTHPKINKVKNLSISLCFLSEIVYCQIHPVISTGQ